MPIDLNKYQNDVESIFLKLIPVFWKITPETGDLKTKWVEYLKTIASSLATAQAEIVARAAAQKEFLDYTGQHLSLVKLLNDVYDVTLRRIDIIENNLVGIAGEIWYLKSETDPENKSYYLIAETDPVPKTFYVIADFTTSVNFTIEIPAAVSFVEEELRALVDQYKTATKIYDITIV